MLCYGFPHILTDIYVFNSFSLSFGGKCGAANFSIFERFKIKRPPKWWMSQYVHNKHNTTWKVHYTIFTHSLFLYQKSYSFTALTLSIFSHTSQLVRKYRVPALSMKYSLFTFRVVASTFFTTTFLEIAVYFQQHSKVLLKSLGHLQKSQSW